MIWSRCWFQSHVFVPPCLSTCRIYLIRFFDPSPVLHCRKRSFLLCCLFVATLPAPCYFVSQHRLHDELSIVRWPFLADQAVGGCDAGMCLGQFLKARFVIFE